MFQERPWKAEQARSGKPAGAGGDAVLLCGTEEFCMEARVALKIRRPLLAIAEAHDFEDARRQIAGETPVLILAEDRFLADGAASPRQRRHTLAAGLGLLAGHAAVIWIGNAEEGEEISRALRSEGVDFVPRSALCFSVAASMVERRLRVLRVTPSGAGGTAPLSAISIGDLSFDGRDFGEVLRHELNNPLTGILGNAELLLLEVRRGRTELSPPLVQRLETITDLAVRMRETVRQLSDRWEAAGGSPGGEKDAPAGRSADDQPEDGRHSLR